MTTILIAVALSVIISAIIWYRLACSQENYIEDLKKVATRYVSEIKLKQATHDRNISEAQKEINDLWTACNTTVCMLLSKWIDDNEEEDADISTVEDIKKLSEKKLKFQYVINETEKDNIVQVIENKMQCEIDNLNISKTMHTYIWCETWSNIINNWSYKEIVYDYYFDDYFSSDETKKIYIFKFIFLVS